MNRIRLVALTFAALAVAVVGREPGHAQPQLCPTTDLTNFSNDPYQPIECWPTEYGPAAADVVTDSTNFLYCAGGDYALCFFSGPSYPTGVDDDNPPLPCVLRADGTAADCTCEVFSGSDEPYYVAVHSILNLGVYNRTVAACGVEGDGCFNLANGCTGGPDDDSDCAQYQPAPVCDFVANQSPDDPTASLIPDADVISAFSFALGSVGPEGPYQVASTPCQAEGGGSPGIYAGCMTAPCTDLPSGEDGTRFASCACPVYTGDFQVGQDQDLLENAAAAAGQSTGVCHPGSEDDAFYLWSASNTVSGAS